MTEPMHLRASRATPACLLALLLIGTSVPLAQVHGAAEGTVDLLATPPEISASVAPNLMISFDDSGSMGRHFMPDTRPYTDDEWFENAARADREPGSGYLDFDGDDDYPASGGPFLCAGVIDPRVTDPGDPRSRAMNGVYYNPNASYRPPLRADGVTEFPLSAFADAWDNGIKRNHPATGAGSSSTRNLGDSARFCGHAAGYYRLRSGVALSVDGVGNISNTDLLYDAANWEWIDLPADQRQNFANWYSYYRIRSTAARSALSRAVAPFDANIRVAWQNFNSNPIVAETAIYKFVDQAVNSSVRARFHDWLYTHSVEGGTPNQATMVRAGEFFTRDTGAADSNPYWDRDLGRELSCRQNFHLNITDGLWNGDPVTTATHDNGASQTLPDGRTFAPGQAESSIIWNEAGASQRSMADIAWHYWRTDLRPDFQADDATRLKVPPFLPDRSTALFGSALAAGQDPRSNPEIYWNPGNNPATWPHLVQFFISFGVDGSIPRTAANFLELRRGSRAWPDTAAGSDQRHRIDDIWHAAVNSRGRFFTTANPEQLIAALNDIIASIVARRAASTAVTVSLPIVTDGTAAYSAGYDSSDWSGFVTRDRLDPTTAERVETLWDAGCILTGGNCPSTAQSGLTPTDPNSRVILTSDGTPGSGRPFRWNSLSEAQQQRLNVDPSTLQLDSGTFSADTHGAERVAWLRGSRTHETTSTPRFRARSSVLGAVIRGQPVYVSSPVSGYPDAFPAGSPEEAARALGNGYASFLNNHRERAPTVFVAANDGMLHAFDGASGRERFAYVPNAVIENFRLTQSTQLESGLTPTVDDKPLVADAFVDGRWRTLLVGSLRLGGRGVYALDISNPTAVSENAPSAVPLWEFTHVAPAGSTVADCSSGARHCSSLGYTYQSVNIARLNYQNKWVALVSSGYFPKDPRDPASTSAAAARTSLLVIDLASGTLIREILTGSAPQEATQSFGLSQAILLDQGADFIDDVAIAGDLAGNLWRFDLSSDDPANWKVDLMFKTYGAGGATAAGDQPIAAAPVLMATEDRRSPMLVFGSGKFLGAADRSASIPQQSFYGVRDYGTCDATTNPAACSIYPIEPGQLIAQKIVQDGAAIRSVEASTEAQPTTPRGWRIRLDVASEPGERALGSGYPFFSSNQILLRSIIPKGDDPCDPGARYGLMVVNAADGSARIDPSAASPTRVVGGVVASSTPPGDPITVRGGGNVVIAGLTERDGRGQVIAQAAVNAITQSLSQADDIWHRGGWRDLQD